MTDHLTLPVWVGAIGKCWAVNSIVAWARARESLTNNTRLLDLGAGRGDEWLTLVSLVPDIQVSLWDADPSHYFLWEESTELATLSRIAHSDDILSNHYDVVTSFSVLEHVSDLSHHFQMIHDALIPGGIGVVLWDDGHFRPSIDLRHPISSGLLSFKESAKWCASIAFGSRVPPSHFQRPRTIATAAAVANQSGLEVMFGTFCGLPGLKQGVREVFNAISVESKMKIMNDWLTLERTSLGHAPINAPEMRHLEQIFGSRLLVVKKPFENS